MVGVFAVSLRFPPPKQGHRLPVADMPRFLRSPVVLVFAALLFLQDNRSRILELQQQHIKDDDPYWPPMVRPLFFLDVDAQIKIHREAMNKVIFP